MKFWIFSILLSLVFSLQSLAYEKSQRLGFNINSLLEEEEVGFGLLYVHEFVLTDDFVLGIDLEFRQMSSNIFQLGYGLLMKHYMSEGSYLEYGLLMSVSHEKNRKSSGTAHDTRLALGHDFKWGEKLFFGEVSYHYSRLRFFDIAERKLDYLQLGLGLRQSW